MHVTYSWIPWPVSYWFRAPLLVNIYLQLQSSLDLALVRLLGAMLT
jgi:hypothetical protein